MSITSTDAAIARIDIVRARRVASDLAAGKAEGPYSRSAAERFLGAVLLDPAAWNRVSQPLDESAFVSRDHKLIFRAITDMMSAGTGIDVITVSEHLSRGGELDAAGGLPYLGTLVRDTATSANIATWADLLRSDARDRAIREIAATLGRDGTPDEKRKGIAELSRLADVAGLAGGRVEPEILRRPLPQAEPFPLEALGPILGNAARRIHEVVQAPAALCAQSILAAASLAVQAHADVEIDGRRELLSLSVFSVGESGERKTAVDGHALRAHREFERAEFEKYRDRAKAHEIEATAYEVARRAVTKGKREADVIRHALEKLGVPPVAPPEPILLCPTPTIEGLHKLFAGGRPSLGLFHDDAGEFLGGHSMSDENRLKSAAGLSRLWDAGEFDRIRAGDGARKYFGRRLAMHLMMQPIVAELVLSDDILTGQGLLARSLLCWPSSTIGSRPYVSCDLTRDTALGAYHDRMRTLLQREPIFAEGTTNELAPRALILEQEARDLWIAAHNAIESDQGGNGAWCGVKAWGSKAPAQILRIAGVLTLTENPDAGVIRADVINRAAALVDYYLGEAVRIVGTASVSPEIRNAEALLEWCRRGQIQKLHSGAALQYGPAGIRSAQSFDAAIALLEAKGWADRIEGGAELDGKRRRRAWAMRLEGSA